MSSPILLLILAIVVILGGYYYTTLNKTEEPEEPEETVELKEFTKPKVPEVSPKSSTLTITEKGVSLVENYMIMPNREYYMQYPDVARCYSEDTDKPEYCNIYDKTAGGMAFVYDLSLESVTNPQYTQCPGGGHDCWYVEKFDTNGNLVDIVDKNGVKLLDKMADDLWSDAWNMETPIVKSVKDYAEFKNGKLVALQEMSTPGKPTVAIGDELTINNTPTASVYFLTLLVALKLAGKDKPSQIVLNIAGAKNNFDTLIH